MRRLRGVYGREHTSAGLSPCNRKHFPNIKQINVRAQGSEIQRPFNLFPRRGSIAIHYQPSTIHLVAVAPLPRCDTLPHKPLTRPCVSDGNLRSSFASPHSWQPSCCSVPTIAPNWRRNKPDVSCSGKDLESISLNGTSRPLPPPVHGLPT